MKPFIMKMCTVDNMWVFDDLSGLNRKELGSTLLAGECF